jgi:hypothetical protein
MSKTRQFASLAIVDTLPMAELIRMLTVELEDDDRLIVKFSDGTTAGYVVEELLELRPFREPGESKRSATLGTIVRIATTRHRILQD